MNTSNVPKRSLWLAPDGWSVEIIDQTKLPHEMLIVRLTSVEDVARAIVTMQVRGAPLIGVTAAYGIALAMRGDPSDESLAAADAAQPDAIFTRALQGIILGGGSLAVNLKHARNFDAAPLKSVCF